MRLIGFTQAYVDEKVYINPDHVVAIEQIVDRDVELTMISIVNETDRGYIVADAIDAVRDRLIYGA